METSANRKRPGKRKRRRKKKRKEEKKESRNEVGRLPPPQAFQKSRETNGKPHKPSSQISNFKGL
jgi:hypothetical protein